MGSESSRPLHLTTLARVTGLMAGAVLVWVVVGQIGESLGLSRWLQLTVLCLAGAALARLFTPDPKGFGLAPRPIAVGMASCLIVSMLAGLGILFGVLIGDYRLDLRAFELGAVGGFLFLALMVLIGEAIPEEAIFRHALMAELRRSLGRWSAMFAQSVLFMLWAFAYVSILQLLGEPTGWAIGWDRVLLFISFGMVLALVREVTGTIWASIGLHTGFQAATQSIALDRQPFFSIAPETQALIATMNIWLFSIALVGLVCIIILLTRSRK